MNQMVGPLTVSTGSGQVHLSQEFLAEMQRRFSIGPRLLCKVIEQRRTSSLEPADWTDLTDGTELGKSYLHFVLSNVVRGRQSRDAILKRTGQRSGRYLDVGCAYGGFVVAFAEAGFEAEGIELDPHWTAMGSLNCEEQGFPGLIRQEDIYNLPSVPTYDVITCNDVIEHVARPSEALAKMASLLRPGGVLYLVIPNRKSVKHVLRDGHYGLFGLGLLDHYAARAYFDVFSSRFPGKAYSCGEMYPYDWYVESLNSLGFVVDRGPSPKPDLQKAKAIFDDCLDKLKARTQINSLDEKLQEHVFHNFCVYAGDFWTSLAAYEARGRGTFVRDFVDDFWTLFCCKAK